MEMRRRGYDGNTSACAEKSANHPPALACTRKYLRVRGEEMRLAAADYSDLKYLRLRGEELL